MTKAKHVWYNIFIPMEILLLPFEFEWDKYNTRHVKIKHGIESSECEEVFFNMPLTIRDDISHSRIESRYHALGKTNTGRVLLIAFTIRNKKIRIITARDASKKERKIYYETT